ncbi:hypothetical protein Pcinc_005527 [Petrolisthes cinctipes]|uniref:Uncharacterized protein n=1 Tax=Petrolisthes cinctipes TaxID=88211 RepID=A0AAE1GJ90_PETCI|nr:hypothetical protein Pcinc_005527 [Petrolisthes cinctipes]
MALITKHIPHGFASTGFYRKAAGPRTFVAPPIGEDNSDLEVEDEFLDDSDRDPDYVVEEDLIPTASGSATRIQPEEMPEEDEDEDDEEEDKAPPRKKARQTGTLVSGRRRTSHILLYLSTTIQCLSSSSNRMNSSCECYQ